MMKAMYQATNVTKAWWSLCQWSSKNRWVKPTWAMTHDSLCNEWQDKRISNIMRCFAGSVRRPWEDVVWSHMKKYGVEPRCGCESHIYMTWIVRQIGCHMRWNHDCFFKFPISMNREETVNGCRLYSLRVMKKCNDDMKTS
jgi:hypothetical protein